jgi:deoxyadenosine/deoxycytidine kinase
VFFLGHRAEQHLAMAQDPRSAIIDRSIFEDAEIFARASLELGNVSHRDFATYRKLYDLVVETLPAPDLLIYLKAPVPVLLNRIQQRGREMELAVTQDYLALLERYYEQWLAGFDLCPVLTIRTDDLDFVHKAGHLDTVVARVHERLTGKEELTFLES